MLRDIYIIYIYAWSRFEARYLVGMAPTDLLLYVWKDVACPQHMHMKRCMDELGEDVEAIACPTPTPSYRGRGGRLQGCTIYSIVLTWILGQASYYIEDLICARPASAPMV